MSDLTTTVNRHNELVRKFNDQTISDQEIDELRELFIQLDMWEKGWINIGGELFGGR